MWATPTKAAPAPAVAKDTAGENEEGWALRADLELCGSVPPPAYAELNTDAHLNTFDVGENGHAVLLGDSGRLFLLNLFQPPSAKKDSSTSDAAAPAQNAVRLVHLELDPPLQKHEVREVEAVRINAASTSVLLVARTWVKAVRIPSEATQLLARPANATSKMATNDAKRTMLGASRTSRHHFLVRFTDSTTETVSVDVPANGAAVTRQQVEKRVAASSARPKRIASISREVYCASIRQVGYFNRVCHAAWHPLSDSHVVVLSDGEMLSVFNLLQDVTKPEQRHLLDFRGLATGAGNKQSATSASSVSFCFGSAQMLWDVFTCYILRTDGSIYALCPLVPYDSRVHESVLETLKTEVDAQLLLCREKAQEEQTILNSLNTFQAPDKNHTKTSAAAAASATLTARIAELKSHKYWLEEAWGPAPTPTPTSGVKAHDNAHNNVQYFRCLRPHVSGISPDTWPLAIQGPVDVTPKSVIAGKNNLPGGSVATSILSVPYTLKAGGDAATLSPFLLRSFTSGHVELVLLDSSIRPKWKGDPHLQPSQNQSHALPALLLECLNLGVDDSGGRAVLERDANDPRLVYCFHSTGVHVINVSWVFALVAGKEFPSLPKSSVRHIFSVSPTASPGSAHITNVIGARVLKNVYVGHLLLLRLASGNFEVVNVSAASSELLKGVLESNEIGSPSASHATSLPETLASRAAASKKTVAPGSSKDSGIKPFADIAIDKLEAMNARGIRVTGSTKLNEVHDEMLAFVIERIKILHEDVEYVDVMDQLIKDRLRLHCEMIKAQREKAATVQQSVAQAQASLKALLTKVEKAMLAQQNLRKRAATVLQAIKENQPMLSRAERTYKEELELLAVEVRRMKPRVTQLTVSGQRVVHTLETVSAKTSEAGNRWRSSAAAQPTLIEEKKKMCFDVLRAESQLIDDTKALIEDMNTNLQQLQK